MNERIISGRKRAQETLRETEERFRSAFSYAPIGMALVSTDGHLLQVNRSLGEIVGYSEQELLDKTFRDITQPDELETDLDYIRQMLSGEIRAYQIEKRYFHKDGHVVWVLLSVSLVRDTKGNPLYFISQIQDITERKRVEEELGAATSRLAALIENLQAGILVEDDSRRITHVNQEFCTMFGIAAPPQALIGVDCSGSAEEVKGLFAEPERFVRRIAELLRKGRVVTGEELFLADGRVFERDYIPIYVDESYRGHLWHYRDITERKRIEQEVVELGQQNELILNSAGEGIIGSDSEGKITFANLTAAAILGWEAEELIGRLGHPTMHHTKPDGTPYPREECPIHISIKDGIRRQVTDEVFWRKDGTSFFAEYTIIPIEKDEEVVGAVITFSDVTERKQAQEALRESEKFFRALYEEVHHPIFLVDKDLNFIDVNSYACTFYGYSREEFKQMKVSDITVPEEQASQQKDVEKLRQQGEILIQERRHRKKNGEILTVTADTTAVTRRGHELYVSRITDITERKRAEEALQESEQRFRQLFEQSVDALFVHDEKGRFIDCNAQACRLLGYSREELLSLSVRDISCNMLTQEEKALKQKEGGTLWQRARAGEPGMFAASHEEENRRKDGTTFPVEVRVGPIDYGGRRMILAATRDITERKALEEQLSHQALHDPLTDLPNRTLLMDRLEHALARAERREGNVAVLFLDLDNFKVINDSLGHKVGDELLVAAAKRLQACLRPRDTIARLSGDEFTILLEDVGDVREATYVAKRIARKLQAPFTLAGREVFVTTSIGIALSVSAQDQPLDLLRSADLAMYRAKGKGKARYEVFDPSMTTRTLERLELGSDLRRALKGDELKVYYQPKVQLGTTLQRYLRASRSRAAIVAGPKVTEAPLIVGMEALLRWEHPEYGLLPPSEFIPIAEENGLILPVGQRVLEEACRQGRAWQEQYPNHAALMISVNLSSRQLQHPKLAQDVARILQETGLDPQSLCLEITESVVMGDPQSTIVTLQELKGLGLKLAVDDFGTGYSSLSYLKRFPVDFLKVDHSFVDDLGKDLEDTAIVSGVTTLAHTLGMQVIAEGVETAVQLAQLRRLGCDMAQGNYFSKPLPSGAASELLATNPH